jgi:hypothetical protein
MYSAPAEAGLNENVMSPFVDPILMDEIWLIFIAKMLNIKGS